ncbi:MAG: helix-turn-helix transcriptional regulator [Actinomycetota bacterium]
MTVVVGVDGAGRTHRLTALASAAGAQTVRVSPGESVDDVRSVLAAARADGSLVLADDAHRLPDEVLALLSSAARDGVRMAISRRPTLAGPALAELDEALVATGNDVEYLAPLSVSEVASLVEGLSGTAPGAERAEEVRAESAGLPAVARALATAPPGTVAPALVARVQRRLAMAGPAATRVARVLMLGLDLPDSVLGDASGVGGGELPEIIRLLRDSGLLDPGTGRMIPAVATAMRNDLSPAEVRRVRSDAAHGLIAAGADPIAAATLLREARVIADRAAAEIYLLAGERLRFTDPEAALAWFDDAAEAGAAEAALAAGRAEAAALLGHPVRDPVGDVEAVDPNGDRLALVSGAVAAHQGRADRAVAALLRAGDIGRTAAVPSLVSLGRGDEAAEIVAAADAPVPLRRLAEAALAAGEPERAVPLFIEAAEAVEQDTPDVVLPDTPHALGAVVAVAAGDASTGEHLLTAATSHGVGGPVAADRHRLLLAWVRLRTGRYDAALAELRRPEDGQLTARDRLLRACLAAGIARRSGDVATLRDAWSHAEQMLARRAVDLFQLEFVEELVAAAARLGNARRAAGVVDDLQQIVERLGRPSSWTTALGWVHLQVAVAQDDAAAAQRVAADLAASPESAERPSMQRAAAPCWADVLAGRVDREAVLTAADGLERAELPWEASRLAGQAAIRTADPDDARRLLERARAFGHDQPGPQAAEAQHGPLSDREIEISRMVLAGRTHREIGSQLYISPKTVEHHVARIRTKLGARSRAELVAALRKVLDGTG